ncbi:6-phosphofructokinase [Streptomyces sp. NPDC052052]|uniref:6-phosphofructokinase n=1 Tax=Streptomyces sp. NPDC052052 TaxID=3154756 RepID=UPI00342CCB21
MRVGVLTGGGDCPGLNAAIRAVVRKGVQEYGYDVIGFRDGWRGLLEDEVVPLSVPAVQGILSRGGTVLGSSRTDPFGTEHGVRRIRGNLARREVDSLIAIGGDDTLGVAAALSGEHGIKCVGVPKTIDNDLSATDYTFGFDTAVSIATEAIDRLHTTADSHMRVLVVEVMGRHAGWIALHSGLAGGADVILIPERRFDVGQVCSWVTSRFGARCAPIVVVAEGAMPARGEMIPGDGPYGSPGPVRFSGVGEWLAGQIRIRTGRETRTAVLGPVQRGGTPSAFDRWLATRFGLHAIDAVRDGDYGTMVALRGTDIVRVPLAEATARLKTVDPARYAEAEVFFG